MGRLDVATPRRCAHSPLLSLFRHVTICRGARERLDITMPPMPDSRSSGLHPGFSSSVLSRPIAKRKLRLQGSYQAAYQSTAK
jgi:hypothetical protein